MNFEYYMKKLNEKMPKMSEAKQDKFIAELNDYNFLEKKKSDKKLQKILDKYLKK